MNAADLSRREVLALAAAGAAPASMGSQPLASAPAAQASTADAKPALAAPAGEGPVPVDRAFLRLSEGLVHYRHAGARRPRSALPPMYLAHAGPGSSRSFEPLLAELGRRRFAIAPDMLGNGDSAPPARESTDIAYYVDCAVRIMDRLELERVDFYGSHTGAQIGCELALTHPRRVRRLILDGAPLFSEEMRAKLLANYAPQVAPDDHGGHLLWAWNFVRDQSLYWPYFERQAANRLANAVAPADQLHLAVTDVLKALRTYHIAYRAAFRQDLRALLPKLRLPVLVIASQRDPLSAYLDEASGLIPGAQKINLARGAAPAERLAAVERFLTS